jgi:hypothetical protein
MVKYLIYTEISYFGRESVTAQMCEIEEGKTIMSTSSPGVLKALYRGLRLKRIKCDLKDNKLTRFYPGITAEQLKEKTLLDYKVIKNNPALAKAQKLKVWLDGKEIKV